MISLCNNKNEILNAINSFKNNLCLSEYIKLYLESYGTNFEFQECFLQYSNADSKSVTAVILRYTNQVYINLSDCADIQELSAFICGFTDCTIFTDISFSDMFKDKELYYVMSKKGVKALFCDDNVKLSRNIKEIVTLAGNDLSVSEREDFFLNTSHQLRHNHLLSYVYYCDNKAVSTAAVADISFNKSLITFVYTDNYFRGNGYSKAILDTICSDNSREYLLLCEEKNIKFYEKCGFSCSDKVIKIRL